MLGCGCPSPAGGSPQYQRESRLPAQHVVVFGHLVYDLVHGCKGKSHQAGADNGTEPTARRTNACADVGVLRDRADPHPTLTKLWN